MILASTESHCLKELIFLSQLDELQVEIVAVASNHEDLRGLVEFNGLSFHHLDLEDIGKEASEEVLSRLVRELKKS